MSAPSLPELLRLSAADMAASIRERRISAMELTRASLEWIAMRDGQMNAFITLCGERAQMEAKLADEAVARGDPVGALHGVPFAVKDVIPTAGARTTYGSLIYKDHIPTEDAVAVARLRRAGAILIGKTNTPEFGFGALCTNALCGPTVNPYDSAYTSGGSSGGSAAAVATGMAPLALGTDLGGSVRTPASFCGIAGLRPTPGRIPSVPKPLLWDGLSVTGLLARSIEDIALMLEASAGSHPHDPLSLPSSAWQATASSVPGASPRVAFSVDLGIARIDPEISAIFSRAIDAVARVLPGVAEGHPDASGARESFETLRAATVTHALGRMCDAHPELVSASLRWNVEQGRHLTAARYLKAEEERARIYMNFVRFFERHDVLATVSASVPPFPNSRPEVTEIAGVKTRNIISYLAITYVVSLVGFPAVSIPCGFTAGGLPVGMQLVGRPFEEAGLLSLARRLQDELGFRHQFPGGDISNIKS